MGTRVPTSHGQPPQRAVIGAVARQGDVRSAPIERTSCILIATSEKCRPNSRHSVVHIGSTNLHHPQVIGRAGLAERNAGDNYDRVCRPGKCLSERCLSRTIDHLLVGVNILG